MRRFLCLVFLLTGLSPQAPAQPADSLVLREDVWTQQRFARAEHLRPYRPGPVEQLVIAIEASADEGVLARRVLGVPLSLWLLLPLLWLVVWWLVVQGQYVLCWLLRFARCARVADKLAHPPRGTVPGLALLLTLLLLIPLAATPQAPALTFYSDDPLWTDPDTLALPPPAPREVSHLFDFLRSNFGDADAPHGPAVNVNTLGEVPNSSWYTNRHFHAPMPLDALRRGPDRGNGPAGEVWTVVRAKSDGKTPGFQILDANGDRYLLKFDPKAHPELITGAEVVATKFFYALGYHVPENYVVRFRREQLDAPDDSEITPPLLDALLDQAYRYPDGTYRAVASKMLAGKPLGPFSYRGTRPDDANDLFPHENRRELRGLRVFSAWLHHVDARSPNSLDMLIGENGAAYVRHYLIDFGSTLGAAPEGPVASWSGQEYALAMGPNLLRGLTFGLVDPVQPIPLSPHPAIGRFDGVHFDPRAWKPQHPNDAFLRMDADDAFWAAKQVANVTDEEIEALVATGEYTDPAAARYLTEALIERRNKIAAAFLPHGGGLDRFRVAGDTLDFDDLLQQQGLVAPAPARTITWYVCEAACQTPAEVLATGQARSGAARLPTVAASMLVADLDTPGLGTTRVYLRRKAAEWQVVGVRRWQ